MLVVIFGDFRGNLPTCKCSVSCMCNYYVCNILFTAGYKNITGAHKRDNYQLEQLIARPCSTMANYVRS